jgi:hypothetical protein
MIEPADWPDTQTKAQLAAVPPRKLAPPAVGGYSLILLERGPDESRIKQALQRLDCDRACPCVVRRGLTLPDAYLGQFELICTDSISIFIDDEVVKTATAAYLSQLYSRLRRSPEFEPVAVRVHSVPDDDRGAWFLMQFFGDAVFLPKDSILSRKKARIMRQWATKVGAAIAIE